MSRHGSWLQPLVEDDDWSATSPPLDIQPKPEMKAGTETGTCLSRLQHDCKDSFFWFQLVSRPALLLVCVLRAHTPLQRRSWKQHSINITTRQTCWANLQLFLLLTAPSTGVRVVSLHMNKTSHRTMSVFLKSFSPTDANHKCVGLQTRRWHFSHNFDFICSSSQ